MSNLPGNPFAEGPDNFRETLHLAGKSHLAYEISATLALAYEQRTANLIALAQLCVSIDGPTVDLSEDLQQITERLGMRAEK
ncbi:hypothetical protein [Glutamicibacter creatinolyticus]|uniref:hypothetical protein n=1 Tax=Glutamicibacter creatinolyticus TaxID=162496 RepID=UPI00321756F8